MIAVRGLVKRYGVQRAVDGVDLDVRPGELVALLGPNGAGKSTTIKAIVGLLRPTSGRVSVAGHDVQRAAVAAKGAIGYVPDRPYLYPKLTARELLRFVGRLRGLEEGELERRADGWLERFGLTDVANEIVETYSHGMRQKLTFAAALLPDPPVLVVDEPMVGLDPRAARLVRDLMADHAARGRAVLVTTHAMEVAEAVAQRVVVLHRGRVAAEGTLGALRARLGRDDADLEAIFLQLTEEAGGPDPAVSA
jgi:ABC-2 type transport system ATP-binding protein